MKSKLTRTVLTLALAVSLVAVAVPAFARGNTQPLGLGLRWLGVGGPGTGIKIASQVLGMSEEDLLSAKASGKTVLQLAEEKGLTKEQLVAKIVEVRKAQIQALVTEGKIDQATADKILANLTDRVNAMIDNVCTGQCVGGCQGQGLGQRKGQGPRQGLGQGAGQGTGFAGGRGMRGQARGR